METDRSFTAVVFPGPVFKFFILKHYLLTWESEKLTQSRQYVKIGAIVNDLVILIT